MLLLLPLPLFFKEFRLSFFAHSVSEPLSASCSELCIKLLTKLLRQKIVIVREILCSRWSRRGFTIRILFALLHKHPRTSPNVICTSRDILSRCFLGITVRSFAFIQLPRWSDWLHEIHLVSWKSTWCIFAIRGRIFLTLLIWMSKGIQFIWATRRIYAVFLG